MSELVETFLRAFRHEAQQARFVLATAADADLNFCPADGMRSLIEVANHLAQIPRMDTAVYTSEVATPEQAQEMESGLRSEDVNGMLKVFDDGVKHVIDYFSKMSDTEFLKENLRPFYETGAEKSWGDYFPEIITHMAMHKMQLWVYLKLAGLPVDMYTYYGIKK